MTVKMDVATLVAQMNEALASIHSTIEGLSTSAAESDSKLDELEQKRDMTLAELKTTYEKEREELAAAHQKELEDIAEQRRKEDEEREARRRREDEELAARKAKEDEEKQGSFDTTTRNVEDEMDNLMDTVEEETAKTISEGEAKLAELEAKRTELNRMIEEQMKAAVPPVPTRKRARTSRRSGAVPSAEPSPLPPVDALAEPTGDKSVDEGKPAENGGAPEEKAEEAAPELPAEPADEVPAGAAAEEDKAPEGDNSQPQPEEPVAEKSMEEATSTEEAHPAEEAAAAAAAPEAESEEDPKDEAIVEAPAPEEAPEPEIKEDAKEEPAESAAAPDENQERALAESEETPAEASDEVQHASADEDKHDAVEVRGLAVETPESAPVEEAPAIEEPSAEEPATRELSTDEQTSDQGNAAPAPEELGDEPFTKEAPAAEEAPVAEDAPTEDTLTANEPATDPIVEEPAAPEESPAEEVPVDERSVAEAPTEESTAAEEIPAVKEVSVDDDQPPAEASIEEPSQEEAAFDEAPAEEPNVEELPHEEQPAPEAPEDDVSKEEPVNEEAPAEEIPAEEGLSEEASTPVEETKTPEESVLADTEPVATEADVPGQDETFIEPIQATEEAEESLEAEAIPAEATSHELAPIASEDAAQPEEDTTEDATPSDAAPDPSPQSVEDDTQKLENEETGDTGTEEVSGERSLPEFSMNAVDDEPTAEATPVVDNSDEVEEQIQPEAAQADGYVAPDSTEDQNVTDVGPKAVDEDADQEVPKSQEEDVPRQAEMVAPEENQAAGETAQGEPVSQKEVDVAEDSTAPAEDVTTELIESDEEIPEDTPEIEAIKDLEAPLDPAASVQQDAHIQDEVAAAHTEASDDIPVQVEIPAPENSAIEDEVPAADETTSRDEVPGSEEIESEQTTSSEETPVEEVSPEEIPVEAVHHAEDKPVADDGTPPSVAVEPAVGEQVAGEDLAEVAPPSDSETAEDVTLVEEADAPTSSDQAVPEAALAEDQPITESEEPDRAAIKEDEDIAHAAPEDDATKETVKAEEESPGEEPSIDAPDTEEFEFHDASEAQAEDTAQVPDAEITAANEIDEPAVSPIDDDIQAQHDSDEAEAEVSDASPTTQEEEPVPNTASKELDDGDSEHGDASHPPQEQLAGAFNGTVENDSAAGSFEAPTEAPAEPVLMEHVAADDDEVQTTETEGHIEDEKVEVDSTPAEHDTEEEPTAAPADESLAIDVDESDVGDDYGHTAMSQPSAAEANKEDAEDNEDVPSSAEEEAPQTDVPETAEDDATAKAGEAAHTLEEPESPPAEALEVNQFEDYQGKHDDEDGAMKVSPSHDISVENETTQHDLDHGEFEVVHALHDDAGFDEADQSRGPDLSAITEHTEPATSTAGDTSGLASKTEDEFHPETLSQNIPEITDAAVESSYMTEPTGMAIEDSYDHDQQPESFTPSASFVDDHFGTRQVHFNEEEDDDHSSPVLSVRDEDSDGDEPVETSYNPFARARSGSIAHAQPTFHSQDIPYNPFALQTVVEEEPLHETTNPFARSPGRGPQEDSTNPFARNATSGADFLRSASALGNNQSSSPEETFPRSPSAQGNRRDSVSSNNPFARSTTPVDRSFSPALSTPGRQRAPSNPFARSTTPQESYPLAEESDSEDEEAMMAAESTYKNLFPVNQSPEVVNDGFASAAQSIERRQPTPQVPETMYSNPFARSSASDHSFLPTESTLGQAQSEATYNNPFGARSSIIGGDVDESIFDQGYPSVIAGHEHDGEGVMDPAAQLFTQENSPLSARHLAPVTLDSIQERYNSELEDMDSDSEEPESLTTSQQLPAAQQRAPPPLPSIAERSRQGFDDGSSEEEDEWDTRAPQPSHINSLLTSSQYRSSPPPPPPPRITSSQGHYAQDAEDSSEDDGDIFHAQSPAQTNPLSSSQYRATPPPPPPPRAPSSQGHYAQQQQQQQAEDSSEEEQADWDDAFEPAQLSKLPTSQFETTPPRPPPIPPPRASSSLSQSHYPVEDSDEEDQGVSPSAAAQSNLPSALSPSGYRATPPPPPPPRAPSSQGFYHQEQADSSEDEHPFSHDIARPGQFPISSSSSQFRATPPPPPPPRVPSSQGQYRQEIEDSSDEEEEDAWDSNAARPGQMPNLSTSQYRATPPPPPPPRAPSALDRHRQEFEDSDTEENEEAWEANRYGQTTSMMGASNLMGNNPMGVDPMRSASPLGASPMRAASPEAPSYLASTSPMRSASPTAHSNLMESAFRGSIPATSSQDLQSHQREEGGEESDDSWENIGKRGGETSPVEAKFTTAPTPQLRVDSYEQQWPNASNDQISTASTYLQPAGPGDFTDTDSQEYFTPLASAGFSASSQDTQGAMVSPQHPESLGNKDLYDQTYNRGAGSSPYGQAHETSLAEELAQHDDSDDDGEYDHSEAPAFLTQIGTAQQQQQQQQQSLNEPVLTQVIDSFNSDEDDGPKTAVMQPDEHPTQYASSRFGASTWRDELHSPTKLGDTRHSRPGSFLGEEVQKPLHQEANAGYSSPLRSAYEPDAQVEGSYGGQEAQLYGQEAYTQQPAETYPQDPNAQQQYGQLQYGQEQYEAQPYGQATSWQPEVKVSEVHAEEEHEQSTPQMAPQQSEQAPDISPLALRQEESPATPSSQGTPSRGLAFSRHNPDRPQTPPTMEAEGDIDPELMVPRDVTNVPWHARNDSVPHSMRSQSTLDSVASSPIHSALHADKHEPVIRDSWPASVHHLTRPRNDSSLTDRDEYDPFRDGDDGSKARGPSGSVGSSSDSPPRNTTSNNSPGSLISRMRGIFENSQSKQEPVSPVRSRPVSGVFHPVRRTKPGGEDDDRGYERKAGFLNEAEDEVDEQSALLRSSAGGVVRVKRDAAYDDEGDELDRRPTRRKYRKDASGLRVPVPWTQHDEEESGPVEPSGESVFRLAWLFVEGWRQKLRKAGDLVERTRWEWELDGTAAVCTHSRASSLTFGMVIADARLRVPDELGRSSKKKKKHRKSVHWA
ncbi:hypothetical protein CORC01_01804 [Colletotrichum orchidophilum]|uniref:Uncharacterized protein n=1 Tax=Colletotrichum orchidophilum TaxID=1209926 RepID=A0A1G4BP37_9PEZI|nr:uncharacterized protein CORC01_01804 [Colletotrichum orchidophilum]OHF03046.1 hypothetical protein CORC01_01804 [Colletotrichum orchidophilum]